MANIPNKVMGFFDTLGINIFRNKTNPQDKEFIIFYKSTGDFIELSKQRALEIVFDEIKERGQLEAVESMIPEKSKISAEEFLKETFLNEYLLIEETTYTPSNCSCFVEDEKRYLNTYKRPKIFKNKSQEKCFKYIDQVLLNVVGNDAKGKEWVIHWLAGLFQKPTRKVRTGLILHGDHGTGKGLIFENVLAYMLESNYNKVGASQLDSDFNAWMKNKQFILCNEIVHFDNKEQRAQSMKEYITGDTFTLREMRKDPRLYPNFTRIAIASNGMIPFKVEDGDRRFTVFKSRKLNNDILAGNLVDNIKEQCEGFFNHLMSIDIDWEFINKPYENEERRDVISSSLNSCEAFIKSFEQRDLFKEFIEDYRDLPENKLQGYIIKEEKEFITSKDIYSLYEDYCHEEGFGMKSRKKTLSQTLKSKGYDLSKQFIDGKQQRAICVTKDK